MMTKTTSYNVSYIDLCEIKMNGHSTVIQFYSILNGHGLKRRTIET